MISAAWCRRGEGEDFLAEKQLQRESCVALGQPLNS
jgi:hypothetical protein